MKKLPRTLFVLLFPCFLILSLTSCPPPETQAPASPAYVGTWRAANLPVYVSTPPTTYDVEVVLTSSTFVIGLYQPGSGFTNMQFPSIRGTHSGMSESSGSPVWNTLAMTHYWNGIDTWNPWSDTVYGAYDLAVDGATMYFWYDNDSDHTPPLTAEGTFTKC